MSIEKTTEVIYTILDYQINSEQRTISKNSESLKLTKKSFDMLLVLLQSNGELVSKDELIFKVWPNQIITDDALYKQITRLRSFFDSTNTKEPVIETVRGVGIKLIPKVLTHNKKQEQKEVQVLENVSAHKTVPVFLILLVISTLSLTLYFVLTKQKLPDQEEPIIKIEEQYKPLKVALIPAQNTQDWLNIGGLDYLSELLQQNNEIVTIKAQEDWIDNENKNALALELSQLNGIDYALVVDNRRQDDKYISHVMLRNEQNILAKDIIEASTLLLLFEKMDSWTTQQLSISSKLSLNKEKSNKKMSDYALESYLRGLSAARNRDFEQASQFLQTAVNQNQSFYTAWLLLAEVESELGHYKKAYAMTETIEKLNDFDPLLLNDLYNVKARILIYQNDLKNAEDYLEKSIKLSEQNNEQRSLIVSLSSQALIHDRNGELNEDTLVILQKQLDLIQKYNPLPNLIAQLNHNLAIVNQHLSHYKEARAYIETAIDQYSKTNNSTGLLSSYRVLSDIHYDLAQTGEALLVLEKAQELINQVNAPITIAYYYMSKIKNLTDQGFRHQAIQFIEKLKQLSVKYADNQPKVEALLLQTDLHLKYHEIEFARSSIKQLLNIVSPNPETYPASTPYAFALDMFISAEFEDSIISRKKVQKYLQNYPELKTYIPTELMLIEAHILNKEGYAKKSLEILQKIMIDYIDDSQILYAINVGFEILDIQWQLDMEGYLKTLNQLQELSTFDYPLLKYRAQYFAYNEDFINAAILMGELKPKAREFWTIADQLLLEQYQQMAQK